MAKTKATERKTLESNLSYIRSTYKKMILKKAMRGESIDRLAERLRAVELQLWVLREDEMDGQKKKAYNGS